MAEIKVLSQAVADKIAAGEVVERPSAVVKELVENSIDAGATEIRVEIKNGGIKYISVQDNGKGIPTTELECAFLRHATSKLREIEDLSEIETMGFRGEALASICAVAQVNVLTRTKDAPLGASMSVHHGVYSDKTEVACNFGTTMVVENLFANVPARMKFLKKDSTEAGYITDVLGRICLANPNIAFRYICDGKEVFSTSGDGQLKNAVLNIYGIDHAKGIYEVDYEEHGVRVYGVVGKAELARGNRTRQTLIVNGRYIKNHVVAKVVEEAYRNVLMTGKFPFFVLNIDLNPELVDVNVHPAKTEIKFANEKEIYNIVHVGVKNAIYNIQKKPEPVYKEATEKVSDTPNFAKVTEKPNAEDRPDRRVIREFMDRTIPARREFAPPVFNEPKPQKAEPSSADLEDKLAENRATIKPMSTADKTGVDSLAKNEDQLKFDFAEEKGVPSTALKTRIVGQVFDTYLVVESGSEMFLIDQHAAHERKRFEMLKGDYLSHKTAGQILLAPIVLDVDGMELRIIKDNIQILSDMGFGIEEFGRNSVIIRETPFVGDEDEIKDLVIEIIAILMDGRPIGLLSFEERLLDMISCKYAIKANKKLSMVEMEALVRDVAELEEQGIKTCPHGRPIKVAFTKQEIEKMFKRIV
ncbi:MAG: DNA mismatch repair endonuclease MutL [Clostridia bacterium]|nr:DNA mismatch repair endonuclease MutL [Clostridia bacterium]